MCVYVRLAAARCLLLFVAQTRSTKLMLLRGTVILFSISRKLRLYTILLHQAEVRVVAQVFPRCFGAWCTDGVLEDNSRIFDPGSMLRFSPGVLGPGARTGIVLALLWNILQVEGTQDAVETPWRRRGDAVETTWRRRGDDAETTWR